jgi:hypothetical protein
MNRPNPKRLFAAALIGAGLLASAGAANAAVAVTIGEPGFSGSIDLGGGAPVAYGGGPLYLRVAPGHERRWGYYCRRYNACGRPVYFVQDRWYRDAYVPHYHRIHPGPGPGYYRREERREFRHEERREERRDERHHDHH